MTAANVTGWRFPSEQALEDFVWAHLEALMELKPLARQHYSSNQVCDILAVDSVGFASASRNRHLTIIELKNTEDRYIVQQLTRYYSTLLNEKPFLEQVDYSLPIRLITIAPTFHLHNRIDREYSRLNIELWSFDILSQADGYCFELGQLDEPQFQRLTISAPFSQLLIRAGEAVPEPLSTPSNPPTSLQKLMEPLSSEQQAYILKIRDSILRFDDRLSEVGKTTTTRYGLKRGNGDIPKNKLCAEFSPALKGIYRPRLLLVLPYPKREAGGQGQTYKPERVKGLTWAQVRHEREWDAGSEVRIYLYFDRSRSQHSNEYSLKTYTQMYQGSTGSGRVFGSLQDLVDLALVEWWQQLGD